MKQFLFLIVFALLSFTFLGQNNLCSNPTPFCTGQTMQFPAGVNAGSAQSGPNYGCLGSQPNPAWFYFQIGTAGPLTINMSATFDIDFIAYGPFSSLANCGNLTAANTVGCSYSGSANETLNIANAVAGQFYILLITNFSNSNQQITFSQTNSGSPGAAQTNCGVLCSMTVTGTSSVCPGGSANLTATTGTGVTSVSWSGPGGFSASGLNASIPNITTTGVYTAQATTSGTSTCKVTRTITVLPAPNLIPSNNGPVCPNSPVNLSVGAFTSYTWTGPGGFTSNAQNPVVNPAVAGTYTVKVTSAAGCTNVATTIVSIAASPTAVPGNNGPVCALTTLGLTGSGGGTYSWTGPNGFSSTAQNPNINNVSTSASGVYTLMVTVGTCTAKATTTVLINPLPSPIAGNNGPVCLNNPINFNGGAGVTYTWTGPGGFSSNAQNPVIPSATAGNAGAYTLSITNGNGCTNSITTNVVVNPTPAIVITNPTVCVNQSINLSATGGGTYLWSGPNGFSSTLQNPVIANASTIQAGAYNVTVTSTAGCTNTATSNVTVITLPTPAIANNTPCVGAALTLTASGGATYSWAGPNGFTSTSSAPIINNVSLAANGIYTLIATAGTCSNSITQSITINPLPVPTASNNGPVCLNTQISFGGTGGGTYTWSGPGAFTSASQNPSIAVASASNAGIYTLTVTNANGCTNTITTNVVVNPTPAIVVNNPTVCVNQSINLTSTGGGSYAWSGPNGFSSNLQNPSLVNATTAMSGAYNVTVTSTQGCTNTAVANVTVYSLPVPAIASNTPCVGAALTLTASGGASYTWNGPNGFTSSSPTPTINNVTMAANGTYSLIASAGTCSNIITQSIIINPLPIPTATSNSQLCAGAVLNLSGNGGTTYTWTGPGSFTSTSQNPSITSAQPSNSGTYTLSVTNANGCTNTITTNVVVNALPTITVNNPTVCLNQAINLTANGANSYTWSGPAGFTSNQQNPVIQSSTQQMNGVYTVTGAGAGACTSQTISTVTVLALPTPSITANTPCVGAALNLSASGAGTYNWSGPNNFSSTSANPTIANASLNASGVYTLIGTSGTCSASVTASVTVNPLPSPSISGNSPVCANQALTFTASGAVNYSWSGPNGYSSNGTSVSIQNANSNNSGTYTVTATDVNGCVSFTTSPAVVNPLPVIAALGSTVCVPKTVTLTATGGVSYSWNGPGGFTSSSQTTTIPNSSTGMTGTYSVTVTDANACSSTSLAFVQVNSIASPNISSNSPVCDGDILNFNAGASGFVTSYVWNGPNGFVSSIANPQLKPAKPQQSGSYTLTITDNTGCSSSAVHSIVINNLPDGGIISNKKTGCTPLCVTFSCQSTTPLTSCIWDGGLGGSLAGLSVTKCYNKDGIFQVTAKFTDINGCSNNATYTVEAYPLPVADFNYGPQNPVVNEDVVFTNASWGTPIVSTTWYFSNFTPSVTTLPNPQLVFTEAGSHLAVMIVTSDKGCKDTLMKPFFVGEDYGIYVPDAFTPNGDGVNDVFFPKGFGIVKYELNIFDRWGEKLFSTTNFEEGWAGNYQGRSNDAVPNGVYVWQIRLINVQGRGKELTGKVTVAR